MNETHRRVILSSIKQLTEITNYDEIKASFLNKGVFTPIMFTIIEQDCNDKEVEKIKRMYEKLTHRGPDAFDKTLEIFKETKNVEALKLLTSTSAHAVSSYNFQTVRDNQFLSIMGTRELNRQNSSNLAAISPSISEDLENNLNQANNNTVIIPEEGNGEINKDTDGISSSKEKKGPRKLKLEPYEKETFFQLTKQNLEVKKAESYGSHHKVPVYSMKSRRRGVLFFVNIINFQEEKNNRNGAERDRENMITLFREMNFTVFYYEDIKRHEFMDLLEQLIESKYLENIDSFFLSVQTHGDLYNNESIMEFSDGRTEKTETIISMFSNANCTVLRDKPKVFFFPFCRGKLSDRHHYAPAAPPIETDGRQILRATYSDILICYATVPGYLAHRDPSFGSWYVSEICKVFAEHAHDCHLEDLLKMVGSNTLYIQEREGRTQVACFESRGFNRLLFLNPKIHD